MSEWNFICEQKGIYTEIIQSKKVRKKTNISIAKRIFKAHFTAANLYESKRCLLINFYPNPLIIF